MNFSSFLSDLLTGLLGSGVGIIVGLQIDRRQTSDHARRRDERLVQNLIDRLAGKRAFGHSAEVGEIDDQEDRQRCNLSVIDARERILTICDEIAVREDVIPCLRQMEQELMAYLTYSEQAPRRYAMALVRLRDQLAGHEDSLQRMMPGLRVERPGARDHVRPAWLP